MKLLLALAITTIPALFLFYVRPKSKHDGKWKNLFSLIGANGKGISAIKKKFYALSKSFANGLRYNKSIRKFYITIMVILMLATEIIDTNLSRTIARYVIASETAGQSVSDILYPLLTHPAATVTSFFLSVLFISYTVSNHVLTRLHNSTALFIAMAIINVVLAVVYSGRFMLMALVLLLLLNAACYYPNMYEGDKSSVTARETTSEKAEPETGSNIKS